MTRTGMCPVCKEQYDLYIAERDEMIRLQLAEIKKLRRGEFICQECGIRKDSDHEKGDF